MARTSEFDSMEESLRDALRHGNRSTVTTSDGNKHVNVYEEQPRRIGDCRKYPNVSENSRVYHRLHQQPVMNGSTTSARADFSHIDTVTTEEFRRYCALLKEKIQKMEEQNHQLIRIAEKQKAEYDKVAAQVVESEESQRLLLNECNNLRKQVEELANSNKRLREKNLLNSVLHSPNSAILESPLHVPVWDENLDHTDAEFLATNDSMKCLHNSVEKQLQSSSALEGRQVQDLAKIIELYSALQKATITDMESPDVGNRSEYQNVLPPTEKPPSVPLNIIHEHPDHQQRFIYNSEYASPSSICATPSCSCRAHRSHHGHRFVGHYLPQYSHQHQPDNRLSYPVQQHAVEQTKARCHSDSCCQSFDNNSYLEVELKPGKRNDLSEPSFQLLHSAPDSLRFNRQSQMRRSHGHYRNVPAKTTQQRRPSSLDLDAETSKNLFPMQSNYPESDFQPVFRPNCEALSSIPPKSNLNHFRPNPATYSNVTTTSNRDTSEVFKSPAAPGVAMPKQDKAPKIWNVKKSSSSASLLSEARSSGIPSATGSKKKQRSKSRSSSTSELPPPPPPPPQRSGSGHLDHGGALLVYEMDHVNRRSRSSSADGITGQFSFSRSKFEQREELRPKMYEGYPKKLSVWKSQEKSQRPSTESSRCLKPTEVGAKWRRSSYARACRKSQSLDHLFEQVTLEREKYKQNAQNKSMNGHETKNQKFPTVSHESETLPVDDENNLLYKTNYENEIDFHFSAKPFQSATKSNHYEALRPSKLNRSLSADRGYFTEKQAQPPIKTTVQGQRLPSPTKSRLQKKQHRSKSHDDTAVDAGLEFAFTKVDDSVVDDVMLNEEVFVPDNSSKPRDRRFSEGSTGTKQKEKLFRDARSRVGRHASISNDGSASAQKGDPFSQTPSPERLNSNSSKNDCRSAVDTSLEKIPSTPQIKFPATNPHTRLQLPASKRPSESQKLVPASAEVKSNYIKPVTSATSQGRETKLPQAGKPTANLESPNKPKLNFVSKTAPKLNEYTINVKEEECRKRSITKSSRKNKEIPPSSNSGSKKNSSGSKGTQSKSFVDVMKARFARASSGGKSNSAGKKKGTSNSKIKESPAVKSAFSAIDPRTLSLEPNTYLPPGKDGSSIRKASKQNVGQNGNAAVGRKLSQPFPNGIGEDNRNQQSNLNNTNEEVLPDEGFAEGSTIERAERDASCEDEHVAEKPLMNERNVSHYENVTSLNPKPEQKLSDVRTELEVSDKKIHCKRDNSDYYDNVILMDKSEEKRSEKRFQVVETERSEPAIGSSYPIKQKHTRTKTIEESPYVNCPLEEKLASGGGEKFSAKGNDYENVEMCQSIRNIPEANRVELLTTGVTILPSSVLSQTTSITPQAVAALNSPESKVNPPSKIRKSASGGALAKLLKNVSQQNHGSKENLFSERDSGKMQEAYHGKMLEKSFMTSVIQAELEQSCTRRDSTGEPSTQDALKDSPSLSFPSASCPGDSMAAASVGTGSSFGSLPSDALDSNQSGDVLEEYAGITSSGSSDSPTKQQVHRLSKSKRNSMTSFGFANHAAKTGTSSSNTSSSSSELNFKAKSKLRSSPLKSPTQTTPIFSLSSKESPARKGLSSFGVEKVPSISDMVRGNNSTTENESTPRGNLYTLPTTPNNLKPPLVSPRSTKLASPSKLLFPGKLHESRVGGKKTPEKTSPPNRLDTNAKTKLAPLGYGFSLAGANSCRDKVSHLNESAYENTSINSSAKRSEGNVQSQAFSRLKPTNLLSQRESGMPVGSTRAPANCRPGDINSSRASKNIPSSSVIRSRPVYSSVGVG